MLPGTLLSPPAGDDVVLLAALPRRPRQPLVVGPESHRCSYTPPGGQTPERPEHSGSRGRLPNPGQPQPPALASPPPPVARPSTDGRHHRFASALSRQAQPPPQPHHPTHPHQRQRQPFENWADFASQSDADSPEHRFGAPPPDPEFWLPSASASPASGDESPPWEQLASLQPATGNRSSAAATASAPDWARLVPAYLQSQGLTLSLASRAQVAEIYRNEGRFGEGSPISADVELGVAEAFVDGVFDEDELCCLVVAEQATGKSAGIIFWRNVAATEMKGWLSQPYGRKLTAPKRRLLELHRSQHSDDSEDDEEMSLEAGAPAGPALGRTAGVRDGIVWSSRPGARGRARASAAPAAAATPDGSPTHHVVRWPSRHRLSPSTRSSKPPAPTVPGPCAGSPRRPRPPPQTPAAPMTTSGPRLVSGWSPEPSPPYPETPAPTHSRWRLVDDNDDHGMVLDLCGEQADDDWPPQAPAAGPAPPLGPSPAPREPADPEDLALTAQPPGSGVSPPPTGAHSHSLVRVPPSRPPDTANLHPHRPPAEAAAGDTRYVFAPGHYERVYHQWMKIEMMAVRPAFQGKKIGTLLLAGALVYAVQEDRNHSVLHVAGGISNHPALQLYSRFGFFEPPPSAFGVPNADLMILPDIKRALLNFDWRAIMDSSRDSRPEHSRGAGHRRLRRHIPQRPQLEYRRGVRGDSSAAAGTAATASSSSPPPPPPLPLSARAPGNRRLQHLPSYLETPATPLRPAPQVRRAYTPAQVQLVPPDERVDLPGPITSGGPGPTVVRAPLEVDVEQLARAGPRSSAPTVDYARPAAELADPLDGWGFRSHSFDDDPLVSVPSDSEFSADRILVPSTGAGAPLRAAAIVSAAESKEPMPVMDSAGEGGPAGLLDDEAKQVSPEVLSRRFSAAVTLAPPPPAPPQPPGDGVMETVSPESAHRLHDCADAPSPLQERWLHHIVTPPPPRPFQRRELVVTTPGAALLSEIEARARPQNLSEAERVELKLQQLQIAPSRHNHNKRQRVPVRE